MTPMKYSSYKESNVNWLGLIPESWGITKIKFNTYVKGRVGWHGLNSEEFSEIGIHLVTGTDFKDGFVNWDSCYRITEERYHEDPYIQLQEGDLLITKDGTIGKLARVKDLPGRATLNSGIFLVRAQNSAYLENYLYWILRSASFDYFMDLHKAGSTIQHLYQEVFNQFSFPIPSKNEQLRLVSYLDRETSKLDTLISKQDQLIELLQEKRKALISHAVTKGLNPDAKMKDSGVEWLGMVPDGWVVTLLKRGYSVSLGKMLQPEAKVESDELLPYLRAANIQWDGVDVSDVKEMWISNAERKHLRLEDGDLLVSEGGDVGRSSIWKNELPECYYQNSANRVRSLNGNNNRFLYYWILAVKDGGYIDILCNKSTIAHFTAEKVNALPVAYPEPTEQTKIADHLDIETTKIDTLIDKAKRSIELAKEHRTALISAAVTGKIDVREAA